MNVNRTICLPLQKIFLSAVLFCISLACAAAGQTTDSEPYPRAQTDAIQSHLRDILSQPQYQPRKTLRQWFLEKFSQWDKPDLKLSPGWGEFLVWLFIIWCVLTLLAILIHFIWTLCVLVKPGSDSGPVITDRSDPDAGLSCEQLLLKAQEQATAGLYLSGIRYLIKSLIRRLDDMHIVRFHESKTNGDYLREYPKNNHTIRDFMAFVSLFELAFYGRSLDAGLAYQKMMDLYSVIRENNVPK